MGSCCSAKMSPAIIGPMLDVVAIDKIFAKVGQYAPIIFFDDIYNTINFKAFQSLYSIKFRL